MNEKPEPRTPREVAAMSFETAMKALEDIVERLESGETPLEESIALYERGELLRKHCQKKLDDAELRVRRIVAGPDGEATGEAPFEAEASGGR